VKYTKTTPCDNCPFRSDIPAYLTPERVIDIGKALVRGEFPCHKTTVPCEDDDGGCDMMETPDSQHCAGALIMLEKMERPSQMMRICERLGLYDRRKLNMEAPVYGDFEEMAAAQTPRGSRRWKAE